MFVIGWWDLEEDIVNEVEVRVKRIGLGIKLCES